MVPNPVTCTGKIPKAFSAVSTWFALALKAKELVVCVFPCASVAINVKVPEVAKLYNVVAVFAARVCDVTVPPINALPSIGSITTEDGRFNVKRFCEAMLERKLY